MACVIQRWRAAWVQAGCRCEVQSTGQFRAGKAIQTDSLFRRLYRECPMNRRRNTHPKLATVAPFRERRGRSFTHCGHIRNDLSNDFPDSRQAGFWRGREPTEPWKLCALPDVFAVFRRPGDTVRVAVVVHRAFSSLSMASRTCRTYKTLPCLWRFGYSRAG